MKMTHRIQSRAIRILHHLRNYRDMTEEDGTISLDSQRILLQQEEACIGLYENFPGHLEECIVITNLGLHIHDQHRWTFIRFDHIEHIAPPSDKRNATHLMITTRSHEVIAIPVRGTHGVFRDIFEFWRFLDRVVHYDITGVGWGS